MEESELGGRYSAYTLTTLTKPDSADAPKYVYECIFAHTYHD